MLELLTRQDRRCFPRGGRACLYAGRQQIRLISPVDHGIRITRYLRDGESFQRGHSSYPIPGHTEGSAARLARERSTLETALILVRTEACSRQEHS